MPKRVLAVGVGGTGKAVLTILKERLIETYGTVPSNVVLLALDTDDWRPQDAFAGVELNLEVDERGRAPEYLHITSPAGVTMDTIFAQITQGHSDAYMGWLEKEKLDRILSPSERDIRGGAQQRRPVGRTAFFLAWRDIAAALQEAISRVYGEPDEERPLDEVELEKSKRLVFLVGSVAGGTGSGFLIDTANLIRRIIQRNPTWQSIDLSAIVVLPSAFEAFVKSMRDPTNLKPNSYAALREVDRFMRAHDMQTPYMIRYDADTRSITWCVNQLFDHVYLADVSSPGSVGEQDLSGDPWRGVFPAVADFIMAHVDAGLGDGMATLRANAGQHYDRIQGWVYSSFNIRSYIFPANDVALSLGYRFLRHMLVHYYLLPQERKGQAAVEQEATKEVERFFSQTVIHGHTNPNIVPLALAATRRVDPERVSVNRARLFNMIALSEESFAQDYEHIEGWLDYLRSRMIPSGQGDYRNESFAEGYERLRNLTAQFLDDFFGPQLDPDNEDERFGGECDKVLVRYRDALRERFAEAVDAAVLDVLNRRDERGRLLPDRLPVALTMVRTLRARLIRFKEILEREYRSMNVETKLRQKATEVRDAIQWMQDTKDQEKGLVQRILGQKPDAVKAQEAYAIAFEERVELLLHQRLYHVVLDVLDALGAAEQDSEGQLSVLAQVERDLEAWEGAFREVDRILARWSREHQKHREQKRRVRVRYYLTDDEFEEQLYREHWGKVAARLLGKVRGEPAMWWVRKRDDIPLTYKMKSHWTPEDVRGPEEIAQAFVEGARNFFARLIRESVTAGDRLQQLFKDDDRRFVTKTRETEEPLLRYNPGRNGKELFHEYYVAFNTDRAQEEAQRFLNKAATVLRDSGYNVVENVESLVACTVMEIARGIKLDAVSQFYDSRNEYRRKIYEGKESLHLFPEEQLATEYEQLIEFLQEPDNKIRPLAPDLVVALGENLYVRTFTQACAYRLVTYEEYTDPETGERRFEVFLKLPNQRRRPLSNRHVWKKRDKHFDQVSAEEQRARLYLQAFRNFSLLVLRKRGVALGIVNTLIEDLKNLGVEMGYIENPLMLEIRAVNDAIRAAQDSVGPLAEEEPDERVRRSENARRRLEQYLLPFLRDTIRTFKGSPDPRIKDLGTIMHLAIKEEKDHLQEIVATGIAK